MKKTKIMSLTLSLALILTALLSVNMTSASAEGVTNGYFRYNIRTYDFDTNTPSMALNSNANVNYTVLDPNASINTTKAVKIVSSTANNYTQNCFYIYISASDGQSIDFEIGKKGNTSLEYRMKFGVYSNGKKYWRMANARPDITLTWGKFIKYVINGNFSGYDMKGNFGSSTGWTEASIGVKSITGLLFKPEDIESKGHLIVDNINVCKHVYLNSASMVKGASIRLGTNNGIRFISSFDSKIMEEIAALEENGYTVKYGTLIAPSDLLGSSALTFDLDSSKYIDVPTSGYFNNETGVIAGSIKVNLSKNISRQFVGRGYVKVYNKDGELVFKNYAIANDNARSLKTLSNSWFNDTASFALLNEAQQDEVTAWANA